MSKPSLTLQDSHEHAKRFAQAISNEPIKELYGVTDGKAVGTYVELKFRASLLDVFDFQAGNAAKGVDFPSLLVDVKVTSLRQPQSSCPFTHARQKVYGLGYSLLVFVYDKRDDSGMQNAKLDFRHVIFIEAARTADFQTTSGLKKILDSKGNRDDVLAFFAERMLPLDDITAEALANEVLMQPPVIGYLTISNALQWRLQYGRAIEQAGSVEGLMRLA